MYQIYIIISNFFFKSKRNKNFEGITIAPIYVNHHEFKNHLNFKLIIFRLIN
jgi:hypothetical protein